MRKKRWCKICGHLLSEHNEDNKCFRHNRSHENCLNLEKCLCTSPVNYGRRAVIIDYEGCCVEDEDELPFSIVDLYS
jgi:hypothetical protein